MNGIGPSRATRWIIGLIVGALFAIPLVSTFVFTLRDRETGGYSFANWARVFDPTNTLLGNANDGKQLLSDDPFKQYYTTDPSFDRNIDSFTGKVDVDLGGASFVSVTSYRKMKYTDDRDFDNTSNDVIRQITDSTAAAA